MTVIDCAKEDRTLPGRLLPGAAWLMPPTDEERQEAADTARRALATGELPADLQTVDTQTASEPLAGDSETVH